MHPLLILRKHLAITMVIVLLPLSACKDFNLYSPKDDVQIGKQLHQEILKNQQEYPILNNTKAINYVQGIVDKLKTSSYIEHGKIFPYKVFIIKQDGIINAFAAPGGYLYVYTGLLKAIDNEATLASIMAHEIAHAERRHSTKRMTKAYGAQVLLDLTLGENSGQTAEMAANLFTGLALLKNSRDDEYEADEYSFKYLYSTNKWYPGAMTYFFNKIMEKPNAGAFKTLLSTHPLGPDRIKAVNDLLKKYNIPPPDEKNLRYREYKEFKRILR